MGDKETSAETMKTLVFALRPFPPFRLDLTAWAIRRRPENIVDRWDGQHYVRIFPFKGQALKVTVSQRGSVDRPLLAVAVTGNWTTPDATIRRDVTASVETVLGTPKDLRGFYAMAERDTFLRPLVKRFLGVKPPRFPTLFEALVNAFACQQLTLTVGILLLSRLAHRYGLSFREGSETFYAFPGPDNLRRARGEEIRALGFSAQKARSIMELCRLIVDEGLDLGVLEKMDDESAREYLEGLRGVGRWSSEYVMLRGLGRIGLFPGDDVGAQRNIQKLLRLKERPDYRRMKNVWERWMPYPGLVYFHLLLAHLDEKGYL